MHTRIPIVITGLAAFATVALVSWLVGSVYQNQYRRLSATDIIPAEAETVLHHASTRMDPGFEHWLPNVAGLPLNETLATIATINNSWIRVNETEDSVSVESSSEELLHMMQSGTTVLSDNGMYIEFANLYSNTSAPWLFMSGAPTSPAWSVSIEKGTFTLIGVHPALARVQQRAPSPIAMSGAQLTLEAASIDAIGQATAFLPKETVQSLDIILNTMAQELLGEATSLKGELYPLLNQPFSLAMRHQNDDVEFILKGTRTNETDTALERIHKHFAASLPTQRIEKRQFERGFISNSVRTDPDVISTTTSEYGPWNNTTTLQQDTNEHIVSGIQNTEFLLSNSIDLHRKLQQEATTQQTESVVKEEALLSGMLDSSNLPIPLPRVLGDLLQTIGESKRAQSKFYWTLKPQKTMIVLTID